MLLMVHVPSAHKRLESPSDSMTFSPYTQVVAVNCVVASSASHAATVPAAWFTVSDPCAAARQHVADHGSTPITNIPAAVPTAR